MQLEPLDRVRVVYRKYDGTLHWNQDGCYLGADRHGRWVGAPPGHQMRRGHRPPVFIPHAHVLLFRPDVWWTAVFNASPERVEVYCDVTTPPEWVVGDDDPYVTAVDLDLDVTRIRDGAVDPELDAPRLRPGRVLLLDEDEFAEHRERYGYRPEVVAEAQGAAEWLIEAVGTGAEPFGVDYQPWLELAQQLAPLRRADGASDA